jgi:hypothetical protein
MEIEDIVGVKFGIENEVDTEEKDRGCDLEDIAADSLSRTDGFGMRGTVNTVQEIFSKNSFNSIIV